MFTHPAENGRYLCWGKGRGENRVSKFEQISGVARFTAMAGSKREGTSLKANISHYLGKQGSDATYEEIEAYVVR